MVKSSFYPHLLPSFLFPLVFSSSLVGAGRRGGRLGHLHPHRAGAVPGLPPRPRHHPHLHRALQLRHRPPLRHPHARPAHEVHHRRHALLPLATAATSSSSRRLPLATVATAPPPPRKRPGRLSSTAVTAPAAPVASSPGQPRHGAFQPPMALIPPPIASSTDWEPRIASFTGSGQLRP